MRPNGPKPERYSKTELKHLDLALQEIGKIGNDLKMIVFKSLPNSLKLEYNYCDWRGNEAHK